MGALDRLGRHLGRRFGGRLGRRRAQDADRYADRNEHQSGTDQVREVEAGVDRRGGRLAVGEQSHGALGRKCRKHRETDRAADLHARGH
jgi:hypothetical protein